ncbi:MAG TPA: sigma 54-interacting transcriptional regulator [Vicinamibacterales bacterium]|nr:sigma 54-interacting transcriptional regulator [Vicinamibacterales bacterium]
MPIASLHPTLARANAALERGRGADASPHLMPLLRAGSLNREDELTLRTTLAEAWLLQDDLVQATTALGRPPDTLQEKVPDAQLSTLWRLYGRIAFAKGEQSRAIALHTRALKHAELAHESRAIGLAHYELALCYKQVGDSGIVRDHLTEASSALHAAGDRRHLALVHSLSAVLLAQAGRCDEASAALRQGERMAMAIPADDVLAGIVHNQANVALVRHRHDLALTLAERSVALHQSLGSGHGLAVALATLGQIYVQLGDLERAEQILTRTLEVRSPVQFHETTGAVFDTLAQIHLMRGSYERAGDYLRQASEAYGAYGTQTMRWYEWSLKVLGVKLAIRRRAYDEAIAMADALAEAPGVPAADAIQAHLAACEALVAADRIDDAEKRLDHCEGRLDPRTTPANWGEFLRIRGLVRERSGRPQSAHHDFAQSANVFELLGERYQAALSELALGRLAAAAGSRSAAERYLDLASHVFTTLGAERDLDEVAAARALLDQAPTLSQSVSAADAEEGIVRRLVDAAIFPELLSRETATSLLESTEADAVVVYVEPASGELKIVAAAGCDDIAARALAQAAHAGSREYRNGILLTEAIGKDHDGPRRCVIAAPQRLSDLAMRRFRMFTAVARQGFELCGVRDRPPQAVESMNERPLEPLLPGFICASAAMNRLTEQIQRLQGHNLTVLITGESGTGKDLVARAIHTGSPRRASMFLPFNCTTTTRELADSQLFGHRRGSFTGAITDQQGLIRSATGGTLFLDEIGDLPLDIQPKLLRFLEQGEIMPVGETRPQAVDVRVLAATNADLEQRVSEGKFREDLYYRLCVIRIHVPPLRDRREEVPHLSTYFLRDACERLGKSDVHLSSATLDLFSRYWWPGNVRQLRNEIQRAVAMSPPGGSIDPEHLSADLTAPAQGSSGHASATTPPRMQPGNLAAAVEGIERDLITVTLDRTRGNISETARVLGLTRRGLYLKMRRLGLDAVGADI